jgi:hypothetical protein
MSDPKRSHVFDFDDRCKNCGLTRLEIENGGEPECGERPSDFDEDQEPRPRPG